MNFVQKIEESYSRLKLKGNDEEIRNILKKNFPTIILPFLFCNNNKKQCLEFIFNESGEWHSNSDIGDILSASGTVKDELQKEKSKASSINKGFGDIIKVSPENMEDSVEDAFSDEFSGSIGEINTKLDAERDIYSKLYTVF